MNESQNHHYHLSFLFEILANKIGKNTHNICQKPIFHEKKFFHLFVAIEYFFDVI